MAWVCFSCRLAVRRRFVRHAMVPCPECGRPCVDLGYKIPVPPKAKLRDWRILEQQVLQRRREDAQVEFRYMIRRKHWLEREIARLQSMPVNDGRSKAIKLLRKELAALRPMRIARRK